MLEVKIEKMSFIAKFDQNNCTRTKVPSKLNDWIIFSFQIIIEKYLKIVLDGRKYFTIIVPCFHCLV